MNLFLFTNRTKRSSSER